MGVRCSSVMWWCDVVLEVGCDGDGGGVWVVMVTVVNVVMVMVVVVW